MPMTNKKYSVQCTVHCTLYCTLYTVLYTVCPKSCIGHYFHSCGGGGGGGGGVQKSPQTGGTEFFLTSVERNTNTKRQLKFSTGHNLQMLAKGRIA